MNHFRKTALDNKGFTMVEVIAILIVVGIVAAIAVSRGIPTQQNLMSEADIVKTHLRFAQLKALQDDAAVSWGLDFSAGTSYALYRNPALTTPINLPGEGSSTYTFQSGITSTNITVNFDPWGSPGTTDIGLTLADSSGAKVITVTGNTGFITP